MKYRLLTQEECAEHRVRYPSAATVLDSGELVCDEIVTLQKRSNGGFFISMPYATLPLEDFEGMLKLLKEIT